MKKLVTALLVALAAAVFVGTSHAAAPPLKLVHTLTGYSEGSTAATADFSLHVENTGDAPVDNLTLSLVPLPPLFGARTTLNLGYFEPREKRDVFVQVVTPIRLGPAHVARAPLFWTGTCVDAAGKNSAFSIRSNPGGAQ